jgi:serine/threonine-protein kinase HipA
LYLSGKENSIGSSLIRLSSGELAYLARRFDRTKNGKQAMEEMEDTCQFTETLTVDKYRSSIEKVGKHIAKFSSRLVMM